MQKKTPVLGGLSWFGWPPFIGLEKKKANGTLISLFSTCTQERGLPQQISPSVVSTYFLAILHSGKKQIPL